MAKVKINGLEIAYEIIGSGTQTIAITCGGRFSKDAPGLRELAQKLAEADYKVLIWDRINTGESDISFDAETESILNADALAGLLRAIDFGPTLLMGGSAGARVSMMVAIRDPDVVSGLFLMTISGGALGLGFLAAFYHMESAIAAETGGMEAVASAPTWTEQMARNPRNRQKMLSQDRDQFVETMKRWADAFFPKSGCPVPGLTPEDLAKIKVPTYVIRSDKSDVHHTRETSETVARMIPGAVLIESPWGEGGWNKALVQEGGIFKLWPDLAPQISELAQSLTARSPSPAGAA
jgi:pimeloyl-ACP methyl ester carboxylesterase